MIEIKNSSLSVGILPETGGALAYLKYHEQEILRSTKIPETEANYTALFPMLPYASFIQDSRFPYFGITRLVSKNCAFSKFPLHGDVWRSKLQIDSYNQTEVILSCKHHKEEGFPFPYTAKIEYKLHESCLQMTLTLQNDAALPMPYGMGIHPFFKKEAGTLLIFDAPKIWYRGDDPILGHPYTAPHHLNFENGLPVPNNGIDISFGSWNSQATIVYPDNNITVEIQADRNFRHLILYAPKGKEFFCLEPVTNTPDAFNLASLGIVGTGIQSLGPHQMATGTIQLMMKGLK